MSITAVHTLLVTLTRIERARAQRPGLAPRAAALHGQRTIELLDFDLPAVLTAARLDRY